MKSMVRWCIAMFAAVMGTCSSAYSQQIWIAAVDPFTSGTRGWTASVDYMALFEPSAPWQATASRTSVFKLGPGFSHSGNEEQLKIVIDNLRQRNISLAIEIGLLPYPGSCAKADEAHTRREWLEQLLARIKSLGGSPRYIAMDEPTTFGRRPLHDGTCGESPADITKQLVPSIALVKSYFPDVQIGTIEVVDSSPDHTNNVMGFVSAFQQVIGTPLAFLHIDVGWSPAALKNLTTVAQFAKAKSVPFGVIYNGPPEGDAQWTAGAQRHIAEVEAGLGLRPDAAIFQTWTPYPTHLLPETKPGTLTNVVLGYLRDPSRVTAERTGEQVSGKLTDSNGNPIAQAEVTLTARDVRGLSGLQSKEITGTVPTNASNAVIGVRIDTEGTCACTGDVDVKIGAVEYRDNGTAQRILLPGTIDGVREFRTSRGKPVGLNSKPFRVTPGSNFTATVPASATEQSDAAGYVTIIFLGGDNKGILRRIWYFESNELPVGKVTTDGDGRFAGAIPPDITRLGAKLSAHYDGDRQRRGAVSAP